MGGVQRWFLSTVLIFLIGMLACVITLSIYVINPIDHNAKVMNSVHSKPKIKTDYANFYLFNSTNVTLRAEQVKGDIQKIELYTTTFTKDDATNEVNKNATHSLPSDIKQWDVKQRDMTRLKSSHLKPFNPAFFQVRPTLTLSFLIDVIRALPQLYLVNRFVKTERLHLLTHSHSHASLSALYVKHV